MKQNNLEKFSSFIHAFGAARMLLDRAHKNGSLIEELILYAASVDGFCRICLVLKEQIKKNSSYINDKYIYQYEGKNNFTEREIYSLAFKNKIIGKELYKELNTLYDIRNKIVHRFFISEVEYSHVEVVCSQYKQLYEQLWRITYDLESEQIDHGVGITTLGEKLTEKEKTEMYSNIGKKIKSGSERNLAKTFNCVSVEEVVEFASKNGLLDKCFSCGHEKINHIDLESFKGSKIRSLEDCLAKCKYCACLIYTSKDENTKNSGV